MELAKKSAIVGTVNLKNNFPWKLFRKNFRINQQRNRKQTGSEIPKENKNISKVFHKHEILKEPRKGI